MRNHRLAHWVDGEVRLGRWEVRRGVVDRLPPPLNIGLSFPRRFRSLPAGVPSSRPPSIQQCLCRAAVPGMSAGGLGSAGGRCVHPEATDMPRTRTDRIAFPPASRTRASWDVFGSRIRRWRVSRWLPRGRGIPYPCLGTAATLSRKDVGLGSYAADPSHLRNGQPRRCQLFDGV